MVGRMKTFGKARKRGWTAALAKWSILAIMAMNAWPSVDRLSRHGVTWDEHPEFQSMTANVAIATAPTNARSSVPRSFDGLNEYYGFVNKLPALAILRATQMAHGVSASEEQLDLDASAAFHLTSMLFGLLAVWTTSRLAGVWPNPGLQVVAAPILLVLYPRFVGHAFFNIKDIPFAALYTLLTWQMTVALLARTPAQMATATVLSLLAGGLLAAVKVPGFVALWPLAAAAILRGPLPGTKWSSRAVRGLWLTAPLTAAGIAVVATPAAWAGPFAWLAGALGLFGGHLWSECTMTWGRCITGAETPPNYLLSWFAVTTPLLLIILLLWGTAELLLGNKGARRPGSEFAQRWIAPALVLAQMLTFPIIAIAGRAPLYDAERHFLFVVPVICVVAAGGLAEIARRAQSWSMWLRYLVYCSLGVAALEVAIDSYLLHPYQYAYYNELGRQLDPSRNFETDFWGFSLGELVRRHTAREGSLAAANVQPFVARPNTIFMFTPVFPAKYRDNVEITSIEGREVPHVKKKTLVFGINRFEWRLPPPECVTVDAERRWLLFAPQPLTLSRELICAPRPILERTSRSFFGLGAVAVSRN